MHQGFGPGEAVPRLHQRAGRRSHRRVGVHAGAAFQVLAATAKVQAGLAIRGEPFPPVVGHGRHQGIVLGHQAGVAQGGADLGGDLL